MRAPEQRIVRKGEAADDHQGIEELYAAIDIYESLALRLLSKSDLV